MSKSSRNAKSKLPFEIIAIVIISELVIAYSILIREISLETFVDAARLAVLLVTGVKYRGMVEVVVASIPGVLAFHEDILKMAVQSLSKDPSRKENHQ